jgi:hypothetical protein
MLWRFIGRLEILGRPVRDMLTEVLPSRAQLR